MMSELKKKRVFIGIPFDDEAKRGIGKVLKMLGRKHWPVRWERVEKLHITLAFLGWVNDDVLRRRDARRVSAAQDDKAGLKSVPALSSLASVSRAVQQGVVGVRSFEVAFKGLGAFPDLLLPRVIWVGLKGDLKSLARVYKQVGVQLEDLGFKLEKRPFVAHVTLGRVERKAKNKQRKEIGKQIGKLRRLDIPQKLRINRVVVYESKLRRDGSKYKIIDKIDLISN